MQQSKARLDYLDSIRGLAALSVVFSHYFLGYGFPPRVAELLTNSPLHIFWDGFAAVSIFFVLSGFVLSKNYFSAPFPPYPQFAAARTVRIWVPYFATLVLSYAMWKLWPVRPELFTVESPWLREFWANPRAFSYQALLLLNDGQNRFIPQDWTLTQELALSLTLPFFLLIARFTGFWGFIVVYAASHFVLKLPILFFHFAIGVLLARYQQALVNWFGSAWRRGGLAVLGLFFYTFRFSLPVWIPGLMPEQRIWYVTGVGAFMLLLFALSSPGAQRWLRARPLLYLGHLSYAIYLVHFAVLVAIVPRAVLLLFSLGLGQEAVRWVGLVICVAASLIVSHFFCKWIDSRAIQAARSLLRMRLSWKLKRSNSAQVTAPALATEPNR